MGSEVQEYNYKKEIIEEIQNNPIIEDGYEHPLEDILEKYLLESKQQLLNWINSVKENKYIIVPVIICLGRIDITKNDKDVFNLIEDLVNTKDTEIRDACIQTLEQWYTKDSLCLLNKLYKREEITWLKNYIERILT